MSIFYLLVHSQNVPNTQLSQAKVRSLERSPGLPHAWQGPKYLSHYLLPPKMHISKVLDQKRSWNSSTGTTIWYVAVPGNGLTHVATMPTSQHRISIWDDEKVVEGGSGDGYTL